MQQRNMAEGRTERSVFDRTVRALSRSCLCALIAVSAAACTHAKAKTVVEMPPLDMPVAPPRVVEASAPQPAAVVSLPDEPTSNIPRPVPAQRTEAPRPAEPPKAEQSAAEPARPTDESPRPSQPTTLQTTPTQREGEVERHVRVLIAQALNGLNRVNYQALNADARNQYETARRFATQAEDALRARNLVFANNLADKAAALAAQLLGR